MVGAIDSYDQLPMITIDGAYNFCDIGGVTTAADHLVRPRVVYRSASLDALSPDGLASLAELGIRTVIDIRSQGELDRNGRFAHEGTGVEWFHVVSSVGPPTDDDPAMVEVMASDDPMSLIFPLLVTRAAPMFAQALRLVAEAGRHPLVFHCTSGKDRTGLLALFIHLIVGVDLETALVDFERSAEALAAVRGDMATRYPHMAAMPPATLDRMAAADRAWVMTALDTIGGLANLEPWLDSIGVGPDIRSQLRSQLLIP